MTSPRSHQIYFLELDTKDRFHILLSQYEIMVTHKDAQLSSLAQQFSLEQAQNTKPKT